MSQFRSTLAYRVLPLAIVAVTACGRNGRSMADEQLRADLAAAAMAPSQRQQFVSPMELGYAQGYTGQAYGNAAYPAYPPPPPGYVYARAPNYPAPQPVYAPAPAVRRTTTASAPRRTSSASNNSEGANGGSAAGGSGEGNGAQPVRNTQRGAVIGAAAGTAVGILTSKDKVKGGAVGAVAGAVLGGVIGSQVYTSGKRPRGW